MARALRRALAAVLCIVMAVGLTVPALASEGGAATIDLTYVSYSQTDKSVSVSGAFTGVQAGNYVYAAVYSGLKMVGVKQSDALSAGDGSFSLTVPNVGSATRVKVFLLDANGKPLAQAMEKTDTLSGGSERRLYVNEPGTVIVGGVYDTVYIEPAVGDGEVTLEGVTANSLVVRGGGSNSVRLTKGSEITDTVEIAKTGGETPRLALDDSSAVKSVEVGGDGAILEGPGFASVTVSAPVELKNTSVAELTTTGSAETTVTLNDAAVEKLTANAPTQIAADEVKGGSVGAITASKAVSTDANTSVNTISATNGNASVTASGPVGAVSASGGSVSLNNSGSTVVTGSAGTISVSGTSTPIVAANAASVSVGGGAGATVTGDVPTINANTTGSINIESASATEVTGSAGTVAVTGEGTVNVTGTAAKVVATDTTKVTAAATVQQIAIVLSRIDVSAYPAKTVYALGETELDNDGLTVKAYYTAEGFDGELSKVVTGWTAALEAETDMGIAGTKNVIVSYEGKTTSFPITVAEKKVGGISVATKPSKQSFTADELSKDKIKTSMSGIAVTVTYTSSVYESETAELAELSFAAAPADSANGVWKVTVSCGGVSTSFTVSVPAVWDQANAARAAVDALMDRFDLEAESGKNYSQLTAIRKSGVNAIYDAQSAAEMDAALAAAVNAMAAVPTPAQLAAQELASAKASAKAELNAYGNLIGFSQEARNEIAARKRTWCAIIDGGADKSAVAGSLASAKADIDGLFNTFGSILVGGRGYSDLQAAITAAGDSGTVSVVGSVDVSGPVTIPADVNVRIEQNAAVNVKSGGTLTNNGTMQIRKASVDFGFSGNGSLRVEYGGSYSGHGVTVGSGESVDFKLLPADTEHELEAGYVLLCGATGDCKNDYPAPFLVPGGNVEVPASKTVTVAADKITTFSPDSLIVKGNLTSTAFNAFSGVITVTSTGSLTAAHADQSESGPMYFRSNEEGVPGGGVKVIAGGSYSMDDAKLIGGADAVLNLTGGGAGIFGAPADAPEDSGPFVFIGGTAVTGNFDYSDCHLIVERGSTLTVADSAEVTLGSNEIRGAIVNNGTLNAKYGLSIEGSAVNNGTLNNDNAVIVNAGATFTNGANGEVCGVWSTRDPNKTDDDGWDTCLIADFFGAQSGSIINNGTISDCVRLYSFVGDSSTGDVVPAFTGSGSLGTNAQLIRMAAVKSQTALNRALGKSDPKYNELTVMDDFTLTADTAITTDVRMYVPEAWNELDASNKKVAVNNSFTVNAGVTLTVNGDAEFWCPVTVNGTIINNNALIFGSIGDSAMETVVNGTIDNKCYLALRNGNGMGVFTIASGGTVTNADGENVFFDNQGYVINGTMSGKVNSSVASFDALEGALTSGGEGTVSLYANDKQDNLELTDNLTIPAGKTLVIGDDFELIVPEGKKLTVNGKLSNGGSVSILGTFENNGTIENYLYQTPGNITAFGGSEINNTGTGTVNGLWTQEGNDGWYDSNIVADFTGREVGTVSNSGVINDCVRVNSYVGGSASGDLHPVLNGTPPAGNGYIHEVAVVESTAAMKRAVAEKWPDSTDPRYSELNIIGDLTLDADLTIPGDLRLNAVGGWFDGDSLTECSFTVASGKTLTIDGEGEFWCPVTVNGKIVNNNYLCIGSGGEASRVCQLNGSIENNAQIRLDGNGNGRLNINNDGVLTNNNFIECWGYLVANNGTFTNSGTVAMDYDYGSDDGAALCTGLTGISVSGGGNWNGTGYVRNGLGLKKASERSDISRIELVTEDDGLVQTMTEDVTINKGVTLLVTAWYAEYNDTTTSFELVIPSGKTLTIASGGKLDVKGKLTVKSGGALVVNGSVDCTGSIVNSGSVTNNGSISVIAGGLTGSGSVAGDGTIGKKMAVDAQAGFETALADADCTEILIKKGDYTIPKGTSIARDLSIQNNNSYWNNYDVNISAEDLTVAAGKTLSTGYVNMEYTGTTTVDGTLDSGPGESVNRGEMAVNGALTVLQGTFVNEKNMTVNGLLHVLDGAKFENRDGWDDSTKTVTSEAVLTVGAAGELRIGSEDSYYAGFFQNRNGAKLINNGVINSYGGIGIENWNDDFTSPGTLNQYSITNLADLSRALVEVLDGRLDALPQQLVYEGENNDFAKYDAQYSDWKNFENDSNGEAAVALLLKNGVIGSASATTMNQYRPVSRAEIAAILCRLAEKLTITLPEKVTVTSIADTSEHWAEEYILKIVKAGVMELDADDNFNPNANVNNGSVGQQYINVAGKTYVPGDNELYSIAWAFCNALGMDSRVEVTDEAALSAALAKNYVTEIHITQSMTIKGTLDNQPDYSFYLTRAQDKDRLICIDSGVTVTIGDGTNHTKLDVDMGVRLIINGHMTISANSGVNVFGELMPDNWDDFVTRAPGSYINFYPDTVEFGRQLCDLVGTRLDKHTVSNTDKAAADDWPDDSEREYGFEFLIGYGGLTYKTESDGYKHWTPWEKVRYADAISYLTGVYKAVMGNDSAALPGSVALYYDQEGTQPFSNDHLISHDDTDTLFGKFSAVLPALPKENDERTAFAATHEQPRISDKNFTNAVTITCSGEPDADNWGGQIIFENCTFAEGVTITADTACSFAVDFRDCCSVTDEVSVVIPSEKTVDDIGNNEVQIWGAKGMTVSAACNTNVSSGSNGRMVLNGVTIDGTVSEGNDDERFYGGNIHWEDWQGEDGKRETETVQIHTGNSGSAAVTAASFDKPMMLHGNVDASKVTLVDGGEIHLCNWDRATTAILGENDAVIYPVNDNARQNGFNITGTGTVRIQDWAYGKTSYISFNGKGLGEPHVFGSGENCQIFVGIGSADGLTFKVEQGGNTWTVEDGMSVTTELNDDVDETPDKLHISKGTAAAWLDGPNNVKLTITTGGGSIVYDPVPVKPEGA